MSSSIIDVITEHSTERTFHVVFEGTLNDLMSSNKPFHDITNMFSKEMLQYPKKGDPKSQAAGHTDKCDILKITLVSQENTFGTDIMFNLVDSSVPPEAQIITGETYHPSLGADDKGVDSPSIRALCLVKNSSVSRLELPHVLYESDETAYKEGNHFFGIYDRDQLTLELEQDLHGKIMQGNQVSQIRITPGTVLHQFFMAKKTFPGKIHNDGIIDITMDTFNELKDLWTSNYTKHVSKVNMDKLVGRIAPAGRTWEEFGMQIQTLFPENAGRYMSIPGVFKLGLSIVYLLAGHYDPQEHAMRTSSQANRPVEGSDSDIDSSLSSETGTSSGDEF